MRTAEFHIGDEDLERYHLGMISEECELATLEEHILACPACVRRAQQLEGFIVMIRAALVEFHDQRARMCAS